MQMHSNEIFLMIMLTSVMSHNQVLFQCAEWGNYRFWTGCILDLYRLKSLEALSKKSLAAFHLSCATVTAFTTCDSPQFNTLLTVV